MRAVRSVFMRLTPNRQFVLGGAYHPAMLACLDIERVANSVWTRKQAGSTPTTITSG